MLLDRAHTLIRDDRKDLRINESGLVPWQIKYKQREGIAKIRNISVAGMLIETNTSFNPKDECIFSFDSDPESGIHIPQVGRLVWHKKKSFSRGKYRCGIKFLEADEQILTKLNTRVKGGIQKFVKKRRLVTITGWIVSSIIIVLLGSMAWYSATIYKDVTTANENMLGAFGQQQVLSDSYANLYRANEIKITDATEKLSIANQLIAEDKQAISLYSQELEATKALLSQTENMLIQANDRNIEVTQQLQEAKGQGQVVFDNEGVMTMSDAQSLMATYRLKISSVKNEIKRIKGEQRAARSASIDQLDNQKDLIGNNGFFIKDGQFVEVDEAMYQSLTIDQFQTPISKNANKNVEIDITFIE